MHCTSAELKYLKKFYSLDAVITLAIQQGINLRFRPFLIQLRDGSIPVAVELMNAENSPAGDFENPAPPVIIIDNEDAPDSPLPDLAPIPPLPEYPDSPLNPLRRAMKPLKAKFFNFSDISKPHEGEGCCAWTAQPKHATSRDHGIRDA